MMVRMSDPNLQHSGTFDLEQGFDGRVLRVKAIHLVLLKYGPAPQQEPRCDCPACEGYRREREE